ncbi:MAG: hypothetical protein ING75_08205 [Rhodocyclaceae bacterium]|nr:hypothetical protein [Rhodocyclaceae bacterium]
MDGASPVRRKLVAGALASATTLLLTRCSAGGGNDSIGVSLPSGPSAANSWAEDLAAMANNIRNTRPDPNGIPKGNPRLGNP